MEKGEKTANGFPLLVENDRVWVDSADHHNMIYGATGSGKTRRIIFLLIRIMCCAGVSMIIPDVKGELKKKTAGFAKRLGYNIISLNMRDFSGGNRWNFFTEPYRLYHSGEKQKGCDMITDLMDSLGAEATRTAADKFWPGMAKAELTGVGIGMLEMLPENMCTPSNLVHLCSEDSYTDLYDLCRLMKPNSPVAITMRGVFSAAERTRQSIEVTLYEMLRLFSSNRQLMGMMFLMSDSIVDANKPNAVMDDATRYTEKVEQDVTDRAIYANSIRLSAGYGSITSDVETFRGVKHPGGLEVTLDYEHCWSSGWGIGANTAMFFSSYSEASDGINGNLSLFYIGPSVVAAFKFHKHWGMGTNLGLGYAYVDDVFFQQSGIGFMGKIRVEYFLNDNWGLGLDWDVFASRFKKPNGVVLPDNKKWGFTRISFMLGVRYYF